MKIENYISILDTKRFGINVAKVDQNENLTEDVLKFLKDSNVKLVLTKISVENLDLINKLEKLNFTLKDIQVTYKYDIQNLVEKEKIAHDNIIIRNFEIRDIPALQKISSESFKNYGHYANDPRLDKQKCNEIYSDWITRSCEDKNVADKVFVADYKGEVIGFLSFKIYNKDNFKYAAGGIGAVSEKNRNLNVFRLLTFKGLHWGKEIGLDWEEHNVLVNNYPVNRSFVKSGFHIYKSFINMHHWIE